jgi:hypothetical protein
MEHFIIDNRGVTTCPRCGGTWHRTYFLETCPVCVAVREKTHEDFKQEYMMEWIGGPDDSGDPLHFGDQIKRIELDTGTIKGLYQKIEDLNEEGVDHVESDSAYSASLRGKADGIQFVLDILGLKDLRGSK